MNPRERGFLLLTCPMGDAQRRVLTHAQLRTLASRIRLMEKPDGDRDLQISDLTALGYDRQMAMRILELLEAEHQLDRYLLQAKKAGCVPITRVSEAYPGILRKKLGLEAPGCLWAKGDVSLLEQPAVALVGSRDLKQSNRSFASEAGRQAAKQGYALVSGNARGADRVGQMACLEAGGSVISVVADELNGHETERNVLWLSEDGFDLPFSAQRALSRNRVIHSLGKLTFVAQSRLQQGGTWDGTSQNLRFGWSRVYCFRDGSDAAQVLSQMGAEQIGTEQLANFDTLPWGYRSLFEE